MSVKKLVSLVFILFAVFACNAKPDVYMFSYFKGGSQDGLHLAYSNDGYTWTPLNNDKSVLEPKVAKDKLMRDPCIVRGKDNVFHMVWTVSWHDKGIGYASSKDLINWSEQQFIPVMAHEDSARNCWAPEIFYNNINEEYMIYWATTISGKFPETASKMESGLNHRMYYVTTKDFETFSDTKLLYEPGFNVIDATIHLENGKYIMFLKDETREPVEKNIRVAYSDKLTSGYGAPSEPITGNYWAEGPTALKVGDFWMVYFDKYRNHVMGAVRSKDLENWEDISDQVSFVSGTRHGTAFKVTAKEFKKIREAYPSK